MAARKKKTIEPKPMFHVGEVRYIKQCSEKFLVMLAEVGDIGCEQGEWIEEASNLMNEYVLKVGKELGLPHYEEIMRIMLLFLEMHNSGKKIGVGVSRPEYEAWQKYKSDHDAWSVSEFQHKHEALYAIAECLDWYGGLISKIKKFFGFSVKVENNLSFSIE